MINGTESNPEGTSDDLQGTRIDFRRAHIEDIQGLENIERTCFQFGRYSSSVLRGFLLHPFSVTYVAEKERSIVASEILVLHRKSVEVASLAVLPEMRGRGLGTALLMMAEETARQHAVKLITLHVDVTNVPAIGLYTKLGYRICERIVEYYGKGKDAYYLTKSIV
jgi:ribosomal-protein-alanine N-acetyltransferase